MASPSMTISTSTESGFYPERSSIRIADEAARINGIIHAVNLGANALQEMVLYRVERPPQPLRNFSGTPVGEVCLVPQLDQVGAGDDADDLPVVDHGDLPPVALDHALAKGRDRVVGSDCHPPRA